MRKHLKTFVSISFLGAILVLVGCGQRELPTKDTVFIQGRALLHGEPIRYAIIELDPVDDEGIYASGRTDGDGYFQLYTYGNEQPDGAVPGHYTVSFEAGAGLPVGGVPKGQPGPTMLPSDLGPISVVIEPKGGEVEIVIE
jgi:hypothetical protein